MKIMSKTPGLLIKSNNPRFVYHFQSEPLEVPEEHAKKILKNSNFYKVDADFTKVKKSSKNKPNEGSKWIMQLEAIKGIGKKTALDIFERYPDKSLLVKDIKQDSKLPFRDDIEELLKNTFR